jgi:hypothetical protein
MPIMLIRPVVLVVVLLGGAAAGSRIGTGGDARWASVTAALVAGAVLTGFVWGQLDGVGWPWAMAAVVLGAGAGWGAYELRGADQRSAGWVVSSFVLAVTGGALCLWLGRVEISGPKVLGLGLAAVLVAGVAFEAGRFAGQVAGDTPSGTDNAAGIDVSDCRSVTVAATREDKPTTWAALGDSYSAGVGGDITGAQFGQEINNAYAWVGYSQIRTDQGVGINLKLSACSGAVVSDLFSRDINGAAVPLAAEDVPASVSAEYWYGLNDALQTLRNASVVTMTLGGNDAGFGNVAASLAGDSGCGPGGHCSILSDGGLANLPSDGKDRHFTATTQQGEWDELQARLRNAYEVTLKLMTHDARLIVLLYPLAFDQPASPCGPLLSRIPVRNRGLINAFAAHLDRVIASAAAEAATALRKPVDVLAWGGEATHPMADFDGTTRPFSPHGLCSATPWLNGFGPQAPNRSGVDSFHPSTQGVLAAGCVTAAEVLTVQDFYRAEGYHLHPAARCP